MDSSSMTPLQELARRYGVEPAYYDLTGRYCEAYPEALLAVLRGLGAPLASLEDAPTAIREHEQACWRRPIDPVGVVWEGGELSMKVRLPSQAVDATLAGHLKLESGEEINWSWRGPDLPTVDMVDVEGSSYVAKRLTFSVGIPLGYHHFTLELPGGTAESTIIVAPLKVHTPDINVRRWGVFLPLYALNREDGWGSGDYSDLERLMAWTASLGGSVVGTLPLLPSFLDEPFDPSPYSPVSRLLWNELYIDITMVPELAACSSAQALVASSQTQDELGMLRQSPFVDYRRGMVLKRRVLEELSRCCFEGSSGRLDSLRHFVEANPIVEDYACFRAFGEKCQASWPQWPAPQRDGTIREGDYREEARRYHLYAQWLAHEQIESLSGQGREKGVQLYLDLPLGANLNGYDVWRNRAVFALDAAGGAPPDTFFIKGQNWGFPPLHPERVRDNGYQYFAVCLRHLMRHAGILRIDHVMGFHRLFWIPRGMEAKQGLYVNYHPEEFYAVLALESQRYGTIIVGEDLGTVPPEVRPAMSRHGLNRMYVLQYQLTTEPGSALPPPQNDMVASLNTHDMPPFAAFWQELDILGRKELGLLDETGVKQEIACRRALKNALVQFLRQKGLARDLPGLSDILMATLAFLNASQANTVLLNLEDLWLETQPQNTPGTWLERRNWCRKAHYSLEALRQ
ncbi:MAG: 4-alpha-glucanotransferase, partial [Chloroflexota bacterium]